MKRETQRAGRMPSPGSLRFYRLALQKNPFFLSVAIHQANSGIHAHYDRNSRFGCLLSPFSSGATRLTDEKNVFRVLLCNANDDCSEMP
jgi:hypothetical protein